MTTQILKEEAAYNHYAHFAKYLILVNRDNPVNTDYVEKNFHLVESQIEGMPSVVLDRLANVYLEQLMNEMRGRSYRPVLASGFRTFEDQTQLYEQSLVSKGKEYTEAHVAPAGFSAHQLGTDIDINPYQINFGVLQPAVDGIKRVTTKAMHMVNLSTPKDNFYEVLGIYAPHYGFILRYPEGKTTQTGYAPERWHLSFVGPFAPLFYMNEHGMPSETPTITMEEFSDFICEELNMTSLYDEDKAEKIGRYFADNPMQEIAKKIIMHSKRQAEKTAAENSSQLQ